jgi:hypothetical protein
MNRIAILRFDFYGPPAAPAFVNKTSGLLRRRHVGKNYFRGNSPAAQGEVVVPDLASGITKRRLILQAI